IAFVRSDASPLGKHAAGCCRAGARRQLIPDQMRIEMNAFVADVAGLRNPAAGKLVLHLSHPFEHLPVAKLAVGVEREYAELRRLERTEIASQIPRQVRDS